jgi:hypothetical protein
LDKSSCYKFEIGSYWARESCPIIYRLLEIKSDGDAVLMDIQNSLLISFPRFRLLNPKLWSRWLPCASRKPADSGSST